MALSVHVLGKVHTEQTRWYHGIYARVCWDQGVPPQNTPLWHKSGSEGIWTPKTPFVIAEAPRTMTHQPLTFMRQPQPSLPGGPPRRKQTNHSISPRSGHKLSFLPSISLRVHFSTFSKVFCFSIKFPFPILPRSYEEIWNSNHLFDLPSLVLPNVSAEPAFSCNPSSVSLTPRPAGGTLEGARKKELHSPVWVKANEFQKLHPIHPNCALCRLISFRLPFLV